MRSAKGWKLVKKRDYSQHVNIVDRVAQAKDHAALIALKMWFESPANKMSSKTERRFCDAYKKRHDELCSEEARRHALQSLSNQT